MIVPFHADRRIVEQDDRILEAGVRRNRVRQLLPARRDDGERSNVVAAGAESAARIVCEPIRPRIPGPATIVSVSSVADLRSAAGPVGAARPARSPAASRPSGCCDIRVTGITAPRENSLQEPDKRIF